MPWQAEMTTRNPRHTRPPCGAGESDCLAPAILELIPANTRRTSALAVRFCMFEPSSLLQLFGEPTRWRTMNAACLRSRPRLIQTQRCLFPFRWKVLQQFLCCLIQVFAVLLLVLAGIDCLGSSTYPNKLLCRRVIDTEDQGPDVNG